VAVIRQFPGNSGCTVCNSLVDLPHENLTDCRRALAREMDAILKRAKAITQARLAITEKRLQELEQAPPSRAGKTRRKPHSRGSR
jgi:hypothetical protein